MYGQVFSGGKVVSETVVLSGVRKETQHICRSFPVLGSSSGFFVGCSQAEVPASDDPNKSNFEFQLSY